jgi:hypothetical protein
MPLPEAVEPPVGNIAPYPNDILRFGTNRWLLITGEVINTEFGDPVALKPNTLAFWDAAALRGTGKPLSDLFEGRDRLQDSRYRLVAILEGLMLDAEASLASDPENKQASWADQRIEELKPDIHISTGGDGVIVPQLTTDR